MAVGGDTEKLDGTTSLELEPAIMDCGELVAGQAALGGVCGAVELGAEPGQERLPIGW